MRLYHGEIVYLSMPLHYFPFAFCADGWFYEPLFAPSLKQETPRFRNGRHSTDTESYFIVVFRLDMVEIRGKRGRKVPVILTPEMINAIDVLIKTRKTVGIADENPYVFARPTKRSLEPMRAWDCLKKLSTQCEPPLSNPTNITSTRMRKYIATISQVLSLKETEVDWLARHLGHDIRVHRDFYRLHESTIEIAKVSKLLLTVDQGKTGKFAGKTLTEIDLNGKY